MALRLRRICSRDADFWEKSRICGHDSAHVNRAFEVVGAMTRDEARSSRRATGRIFIILKSLTCTSSNVVYLAECVLCGLQGVGSTANFKSRLANYKSHIKHKRRYN
jgi:hypothetical protein